MKNLKLAVMLSLLFFSNALFAQELKQNYTLKNKQTYITPPYFAFATLGVGSGMILSATGLPVKIQYAFPDLINFIGLSGILMTTSFPTVGYIEATIRADKKIQTVKIQRAYNKFLANINYTLKLKQMPPNQSFQKAILELPILQNEEPLEKVKVLKNILLDLKLLANFIIDQKGQKNEVLESEIQNSQTVDDALRKIFGKNNSDYNQDFAKKLLIFTIIAHF